MGELYDEESDSSEESILGDAEMSLPSNRSLTETQPELNTMKNKPVSPDKNSVLTSDYNPRRTSDGSKHLN